MTIGERIRMRRKELNLTMQTIFEKENIKTGNLSELEHDKYLPSVQTLVALGRVLNCSIDWLLTGENHGSNCEGPKIEEALKSEISLIPDGMPLTDEETNLIAMYRQLPDYQQEDAFDLIYFKYKKHVEKKKESIYSAYTRGSSRQGAGPAEDDSNQGGIA